jgi:hypothetical protein
MKQVELIVEVLYHPFTLECSLYSNDSIYCSTTKYIKSQYYHRLKEFVASNIFGR